MMASGKILKAYARATKRMDGAPYLSATQTSAGFVFPQGQKRGHRKGYQVFVKVCRYSDELLASKPDTGGLSCENRRIK